MNSITSSLPLAAGAGGGYELGQNIAGLINYYVNVPPDIASNVTGIITWIIVPLAALATHWWLKETES